MNINFPNGDSTKAGINVRPHAQETLRELAEHFDIIIFTASHECYANVVIDYLDPTKTLVKSRYFRDSCYRTQ
jgi:CTD small phosphatase-like protein 2